MCMNLCVEHIENIQCMCKFKIKSRSIIIINNNNYLNSHSFQVLSYGTKQLHFL